MLINPPDVSQISLGSKFYTTSRKTSQNALVGALSTENFTEYNFQN